MHNNKFLMEEDGHSPLFLFEIVDQNIMRARYCPF